MEVLDSAPPVPIPADEIGIDAPKAAYAPAGWSPLARIGFRIAFIYFCCFMLVYGNDSTDFSGIIFWHGLRDFINWPLNHLAAFAADHIFHLKHVGPVPFHWNGTHLNDITLNWTLAKLMIAGAVIGGLGWTATVTFRGSRRTEYRTLLAWLRFLLRLSVAFFMVGYGFIKVFPLQMAPIALGALNTPFGQISREMLLWSFVGQNPIYQSICGVAEVTAGVLLLFRRTALAGALLAIFMVANVVLYDVFFNVGVQIFATNLLLAAIFLVLPDANRLLDFFWRHKTTVQTGVWTPPLDRRSVRIYVRAMEIVFIVGLLTVNPLFDGIIWHHQRVIAGIQSPLLGGWRVDHPEPGKGPFMTPKGPAIEIYLDTVEHALRRSSDGRLWTTFMKINPTAHTIFVKGKVRQEHMTYSWRMPDANHLILTSQPPKVQGSKTKGDSKAAPAPAITVIALTRIHLPAHYRLLDRTFHLVNHSAMDR